MHIETTSKYAYLTFWNLEKAFANIFWFVNANRIKDQNSQLQFLAIRIRWENIRIELVSVQKSRNCCSLHAKEMNYMLLYDNSMS